MEVSDKVNLNFVIGFYLQYTRKVGKFLCSRIGNIVCRMYSAALPV